MPAFGRTVSLLPSAGVAVLSKFTCSFCVGAYTGLLSSLGVGSVATEAGLTWLTVGLLTLGIVAVAWSTRRHRQLGPLGLMLLGSGVLLVARLDQPSPTRVLIAGAVLAVGASLWNFRLERRKPSCCMKPMNQPIEGKQRMATKRTVEVFTAGCAVCDEAVQAVRKIACDSCDVQVQDMRTDAAKAKAKKYGIKRVPAVVVNGQLAECCKQGAIDTVTIQRLGVGHRA